MTASLKLNNTVLLYAIFTKKQSHWNYSAWIIIIRMLPFYIHPHISCSVTFGSLPAPHLLQGPHHCRRDRCLPGMWSGTTLCWTFVPVPCLPDTTDNLRPMGRPRCGGWFSQARELTKGGELWATITTTTSLCLCATVFMLDKPISAKK